MKRRKGMILSGLVSLVLLGLLVLVFTAPFFKSTAENPIQSAVASPPGATAFTFTPTLVLPETSEPVTTPTLPITATVTLTEPAFTPTLAFTPTDTPATTPTLPITVTATPTEPAFTPTDTPTTTPTPLITTTATPTALTSTPTLEPTIAASPSPTATPDVTKDWKIYENREYGFRVKYPPQFAYVIIPGYPSNEVLYEMYFYDGTKYRLSDYQPSDSLGFPRITLAVIKNPQRLSSMDAWAKAHLFSSPGSNQYSLNFESYEIVRTLNIAGVQAARLTAVSGYGTTGHLILIPLPNEAKIIYLSYHIDPSTIETLFELMASTLELIR